LAASFILKFPSWICGQHHAFTAGPAPRAVEVGPDVATTMAADLAGEARLKVGQPHIVGPGVGGDRRPVAAAVV